MNPVPPWAEPVWRNFRRLAGSTATLGTVVFLALIQLGVTAAGWTASQPEPWEFWGLSMNGVLSGKIHQFVTYGLLHGSWFHFLANGVFVLAVGSRVEHMVGPATLIRASLAGVLAGALAHLGLSQGVLVGFSGAALAIWMLLIGLSPDARMPLFPASCLWLGWGVVLLSLLLSLCDPAGKFVWFHPLGIRLEKTCGQWLFQIGNACHFGGGLAGWILGLWILRPRVTLSTLRKQRAARESGDGKAGRRAARSRD